MNPTKTNIPRYIGIWGFPSDSAAKNAPALQEQVQSLGREDSLEGESTPAKYSCLENPRGQRSLEGYSPWGCKELDTTEATEHACI